MRGIGILAACLLAAWAGTSWALDLSWALELPPGAGPESASEPLSGDDGQRRDGVPGPQAEPEAVWAVSAAAEGPQAKSPPAQLWPAEFLDEPKEAALEEEEMGLYLSNLEDEARPADSHWLAPEATEAVKASPRPSGGEALSNLLGSGERAALSSRKRASFQGLGKASLSPSAHAKFSGFGGPLEETAQGGQGEAKMAIDLNSPSAPSPADLEEAIWRKLEAASLKTMSGSAQGSPEGPERAAAEGAAKDSARGSAQEVMRTQAPIQASIQASSQASSQASGQASGQASIQGSGQASIQGSAQASPQDSARDSAQASAQGGAVVWLASRALDGPESGLKDPEDAKDRLPASEKKPGSKKRKEAMAPSNLTEGRPKSLAGRSAPSADESIALSHFGAGEELPRAKTIQISSAAAANSPASGAPLSSEASQGPPGSSKDAGSKDGGSNEDRRKDEPSGGAREEAETEEIDPEELEAAERQRIYQESLSMLLPASTEEIRGYRKKADEKAKAASDAPIGELLSRTVPIRPEPGEKPPVVSLTPNMVAALIFLDSEGKIWPIASSVLGSGSLFQAETLGESSPGKMIVAPLVNHGTSNLIVTLRDLDMPLVIELTASSALNEGRSVDSLVIFQVGQAGPGSSGGKKGAAPPPPKALDERLYAVMDSMSPKGGRRLKASPALEGEAVYLAGASMYLRTRRSLLWPAPKAKASGPGSLAVYELSPATKLLLTSDGEISELFVPEAKDAGAYESFSGGKEARK